MKISVIGAGNMGGALLEAIIKMNRHEIKVFDPSEKAKAKFSEYKCAEFACSEAEAVKDADLVIIAVKPKFVDAVCEKIVKSFDPAKTVLLSVAAGVKVSVYEKHFGNIGIVRTMPNLPALCGEGYTGLYFKNVNDEKLKSDIIEIFSSVGETGVFPSEDMIDRLIPVTSSSPAYICLLIEAMADGAVRLGFSRDAAYKMCEQAVLGTAQYLKESGMHPAELKDRVCSPAGTTIEAVLALEENGFRNSILKAMDKCYKKLN